MAWHRIRGEPWIDVGLRVQMKFGPLRRGKVRKPHLCTLYFLIHARTTKLASVASETVSIPRQLVMAAIGSCRRSIKPMGLEPQNGRFHDPQIAIQYQTGDLDIMPSRESLIGRSSISDAVRNSSDTSVGR